MLAGVVGSAGVPLAVYVCEPVFCLNCVGALGFYNTPSACTSLHVIFPSAFLGYCKWFLILANIRLLHVLSFFSVAHLRKRDGLA